MNGPRSSASLYGEPESRLKTESDACHAAAASAPASAPLTSAARPRRLRELLANELADVRAVGAPGDLRHHVGHHATQVGHARGTHLGDRIVDDLLDLILGERLGHELLED